MMDESAVSMSDMPAVNRAGKTMIEAIDNPCAACPAETPSKPTSVAVSKPSPKRSPSG